MREPRHYRTTDIRASKAITLLQTVAFLGCAMLLQTAQAQTFSVLYSFKGAPDGSFPSSGLVRDAAGNLYGTTNLGGTSTACNSDGCGTVFKIDTSGNETILHNFNGLDGQYPIAGLIRDGNGNFYGTTTYGGTYGYGVVFKMDPTGVETVLYNFTGGSDGSRPNAGLVRDSGGNLYGTTVEGGSSTCSLGCGVVFKLDPTGTETVLHAFTGPDGAAPYASVILGPGGNIYGTTFEGGSSTCGHGGCGVVFKLAPNGQESVVHNFAFGTEGANPYASLLMDKAGNLYGTASDRGTNGCEIGCGAVFKLNPVGQETVLLRFSGYPIDGEYPEAGVVMDATGNLYGTTFDGGPHITGTVFKLDPTGTETLLHSFVYTSDGAFPSAGVTMDAVGNVYSTAQAGGPGSYGTVFKIAP
jgi:uncharacterized repeat protein (TIGR03803 family)